MGQGALAVEIRSDNKELIPFVTTLHHEETSAATTAERSLLKELEGGCQVPIGAYAHVEEAAVLSMQAVVASLDGTVVVKGSCEGKVSDPIDLGKRLASDLVSRGADRILEQIRDAGVAGR